MNSKQEMAVAVRLNIGFRVIPVMLLLPALLAAA
jgi:hypothetical protein